MQYKRSLLAVQLLLCIRVGKKFSFANDASSFPLCVCMCDTALVEAQIANNENSTHIYL